MCRYIKNSIERTLKMNLFNDLFSVVYQYFRCLLSVWSFLFEVAFNIFWVVCASHRFMVSLFYVIAIPFYFNQLFQNLNENDSYEHTMFMQRSCELILICRFTNKCSHEKMYLIGVKNN